MEAIECIKSCTTYDSKSKAMQWFYVAYKISPEQINAFIGQNNDKMITFLSKLLKACVVFQDFIFLINNEANFQENLINYTLYG